MRTASATFVAGTSTNLDIDCTDMGTVTYQLVGNWDGSVTFKGSYNGTDFHQIYGLDETKADGQLYGTSNTDNGSGPSTNLKFDVAAITTFRCDPTGGTGSSGSSVISLTADLAQGIITGIIAPVFIGNTSPIETSGTVTANAGTNLNTSLLALDSTVAKDASLTTLNTSVNTLLKPASTLTKVSTVDTITNPVTLAASSAVIGHVITDSGSTTAVTGNVATTVADGANVTLGAKADAKSTATDTTPISMMQVLKQISASVQAPPSQAVTNTGTFATQSTLAAETTKVIGTVNIAASQTVGLAAGAATIGALTANQSVNTAQVNGGTTVTSVTGVQDVMPRKRTGSTGLSPNYYSTHITSKTTTTPTSSTAYVSAIIVSCTGAGTSWTLTIKDKQATALTLIPSITLTVPTAGPLVWQFEEPILMTSGIDIVTAGTTAGTVDVFVTYWQ